MKKVTLTTLMKRYAAGEKLVMSTAYDAVMARLCALAGVDLLLVGDSVGMTLLGYENTLPVTMEDMLRHTAAVRRGAPESFVVFDMPFMSYQESDTQALHNAGLAMKTTGADAVKLEGGAEYAPLVRKMTGSGIPVMGHLGLTTQSINKFGTYTVRAREEAEAEKLIADAKLLEEIGCFAIVIEKVPAELAERVAKELTIPIIGIGAGGGVDGQVLVMHDMLGINKGFSPRFLRRYADLDSVITNAVQHYIEDVKSGDFPNEREQY